MATRIEKSAIIEPGAIIGEHCYIGYNTIIRPGVVIGDYSEIRANCFVGANAKIGRNTNINQLSSICQYIEIGDYVFIGPGVITTNTKRIAFKRNYEGVTTAPKIMYGARIGAGVTILPGVIIGENALIGAGSVVTKSVSGQTINLGVPCRQVGIVNDEEII